MTFIGRKIPWAAYRPISTDLLHQFTPRSRTLSFAVWRAVFQLCVRRDAKEESWVLERWIIPYLLSHPVHSIHEAIVQDIDEPVRVEVGN